MRTTRGNGGNGHTNGYGAGGRNGGRRGAPHTGHSAPAPKSQPKHAVSGVKPALRIGTALFLLLVAVVIVVGIVNNMQNNSDPGKFTRGVKINGADVSGRDVEEVRAELKAKFQEKIAGISIKITHGEKSWTLTGADIGAADNVDAVVDEAIALAHTGDKERDAAEARKVRAEGREFAAELSLDQTLINVKLNAIAAEVSVSGRDATVSFNPEAMKFKDPEEPSEKELNDLDKMFTINEEVAGVTVDVEMMAQKIADDLEDDYRAEQELLVTQFVPTVTAEKLRKSFRHVATFRTKISSASTDERVTNIAVALRQFNGKVLQSGEEISFNDTTGPRNEANGYQIAHVINSGAYVDDWGGGVCQASTTLYNAILLAGFDATDRGHHSIPSDYVKPLGFDAMVNYPNGDLKFKNTSSGPIYIKAWVSPLKNAYVMIFGEPLGDNAAVQGSYKGCAKIERYSELIFEGEKPGYEVTVDKNNDYEGQYTDDVTLDDGTKVKGYVSMRPHPDITVDAYLIYKDANGNELGRKKLYQDKFKQVKGMVYVPAVAATPKPTRTPKPDATGAPDSGE